MRNRLRWPNRSPRILANDDRHRNDQPIAAAAGSRSAQRLVEVLLIVLVFFVVAGDPPPHVNEAHYLCRLKHFWNPDWCAGDLFLESTDTQVVFIWTFGWVTRWLSLTATAWVGRVVGVDAVGLGLAAAELATGAAAASRPCCRPRCSSHSTTRGPSGRRMGRRRRRGKCFAYVFVLLALRELVDRRWNAVWFLLGAASAFHPLVGGWSGVVCGGIWLLERSPTQSPLLSMLAGIRRRRTSRARSASCPRFVLTWNEPADIVAEAARIYVFERLPHHLALLTLPRDEISLRFVRHAALIVALVAADARRKARLAEPAAPLAPHRPIRLGRCCSWRSSDFAIELAFWNQPLIAAKLLRYYWFRLTDFAVPMAVALYAVAIIAAGLERRRTWAVWALTIVLVLVGWQLSSTARQRALNPIPPADAKVRDLRGLGRGLRVDRREHAGGRPVPHAALVAIVQMADRPARSRQSQGYSAGCPSIVEWFDRMKNILRREVNGVTEWLDSLGELGTERVRELADQYGFDYVLMDRGQLLSLPIVYKNEEYVVYRVKN